MGNRSPSSGGVPEPYRVWLKSALEDEGPPRHQHPADELLAEHHLMGAVLAAMREEARGLVRNAPLRPQLWGLVVDFIGNFTHRIHRVKEEQLLFPALWDGGLVHENGFGRLERQHGLLHRLTLELCDGVSAGDWKSTARVVYRYVDLMGPHLAAEEESLVADATRQLEPERVMEIRRAFDALEAERMPPKGRRHYLDVARRLCEETGVEGHLDP